MPVPSEVESLIAEAPLSAHLATSVDDRPHVAAIWYGYRDGVLYALTGGRKLANVRRNPRVAVSIEDARGGDVAWNVTLLGTATVNDDRERMDWASDWIFDRYGDETDGENVDGEEVGTDEGGETSENGSDDTRSDGGTSDDSEGDYALLEIDIGSVSWNVYE